MPGRRRANGGASHPIARSGQVLRGHPCTIFCAWLRPPPTAPSWAIRPRPGDAPPIDRRDAARHAATEVVGHRRPHQTPPAARPCKTRPFTHCSELARCCGFSGRLRAAAPASVRAARASTGPTGSNACLFQPRPRRLRRGQPVVCSGGFVALFPAKSECAQLSARLAVHLHSAACRHLPAPPSWRLDERARTRGGQQRRSPRLWPLQPDPT